MGAPLGYPSAGEARVAEYLDRRGLGFDYEPSIGGRNPDFLAYHPLAGDAVLEVYEPELRLPNRVGSFDGIAALAGAFSDRKRKQAQAARREGVPFVLVIASTNCDVSFDWMAAVGILRGRPGVTFEVGVADPKATMRPALIGIGKTGGGANTSVSAIALIDRFNPTLWRLQAAWKERLPERSDLPSDRDRRVRHLAQLMTARAVIEEELTDGRIFHPDLRTPKLQIFHNPGAAVPLPFTFAGPHDEQWAAIEMEDMSEGYGPVAYGRLCWEWLRLG